MTPPVTRRIPAAFTPRARVDRRAARKGSDLPAPEFGGGLQARGADSPEAALEALLRAGAELDVRRILELFPPGEADALHDYAPLFLDNAERAISETGGAVDITIDALDLSSRRDGERALVKLDEFAFTATFTEGQHTEFTISYADGCTRFSAPAEEQQEFCNKGGTGFVSGFGFPFGGIDPPKLDLEQPDAGFVAVEREGAWYVSPTASVLDNVNAVLRVFERRDLDVLRDWFEGFQEQFEERAAEAAEAQAQSGRFGRVSPPTSVAGEEYSTGS